MRQTINKRLAKLARNYAEHYTVHLPPDARTKPGQQGWRASMSLETKFTHVFSLEGGENLSTNEMSNTPALPSHQARDKIQGTGYARRQSSHGNEQVKKQKPGTRKKGPQKLLKRGTSHLDAAQCVTVHMHRKVWE